METCMKSNLGNNLEAKLCGRPQIFFFIVTVPNCVRVDLSGFHNIASSNFLSAHTIAGEKVVESSSLYARLENALPLILQ